MNILLVGATGNTGQILLKMLAETEHNTTGLIRSINQKNLVTDQANYLTGDLTTELESIVNGFDVILFAAGSRGKDVEGVDYQGLVNIVDACVKARINRLIYLGSANTGKKRSQFIQEMEDYYQKINEPVPEKLLQTIHKPGYANYLEKKEMAEAHLIASGMDYTILRAGLLTFEKGSGKVDATGGVLNHFGIISRENVARCFIECLENKSTYQQIYNITDGETPINKAFIQL